MLPNLHIPPLEIYGPLILQPFVLLVGIAVLLGCELAYRRGRATGLNRPVLVNGILVTVGVGFIVSHWAAVLFSRPELILNDPLILFMFWGSQASFGGLLGGILGGWIYFRRKQVPPLPYLETMMFGFVPAWIIGRLGCTITFDHPGVTTEFVLGMADRMGVVRHNLGFYEMLLAVLLTALLYGVRKIRPFEGFHTALVILIYAPVRFYLDTLRVADRNYWGLTLGQYGAIVLLALGVFLLFRGLKERTILSELPNRVVEVSGS